MSCLCNPLFLDCDAKVRLFSVSAKYLRQKITFFSLFS
nr:MAG TPA: hypothetical protein [Caudoviricetes sp.]